MVAEKEKAIDKEKIKERTWKGAIQKKKKGAKKKKVWKKD